jgi:hypothetical protein
MWARTEEWLSHGAYASWRINGEAPGIAAFMCPPSTPHQLTRVDVSTRAERPPSLYTDRAAAADTGRARGAVKGSAAPDLWLCEHAGGAWRGVHMELRA